MDNPSIIRLATGETPGPIFLGRIPDKWANHVGASTRWVKLSKYNLDKQMRRHREFELENYEDIDWILENGEVIIDPRENVIHFIGDTEAVYGNRTKVTVKTTRSGYELYMTSAHRLRASDYNRMKRRASRCEN